jgi:alkanesulfonate monooxygenase SsuD/methylene tetrahydromethanopterin reductase-like flavin-dependent oxidoreductase (luciferase family)
VGKVEFAWVFQPAARPGEDGSSLLENNTRFIDILKPHISAVWVEDHFQWEARPMIECWTTLTYLAGLYPDLVVAPLVLGQSYRNPALTAKMAATLHYLTGGRMVFGIGAGWKADEYRAYGWDYPTSRVRIEQLDEALSIIKAMWKDAPASFKGRHYQIEDAYCEPRPNPVPPIMVGGGGEKHTLRVVAKHADWWNTPFCTVEEYHHKLSALSQHCAAVGRNPAEIRKTYFGFCSITRDPDAIVRREGLHVIGGTPEIVADELQAFADLGVDYFILRFLDFPQVDGAKMFLNEVLPRFR